MTLDYARYGRQIALPELSATGQEKLARTPVRFASGERASESESETSRLAGELHARAGGAVVSDERSPSPDALAVPVTDPPWSGAPARPATVGIAAHAAVEAARRVMGLAPRALPEALLARLAPPSESHTE